MTLEEFESTLMQIQSNLPQTKTLNALYTLAKHVTNLSNAVVEIQNKLNQIIIEVNQLKEKEKEREEKEDVSND